MEILVQGRLGSVGSQFAGDHKHFFRNAQIVPFM